MKTLMKYIHQSTIKYLNYLVLNRRLFDNQQVHANRPRGTNPLA